MEIWFWAAVGGAVFAGLSNFYFKIAAVKNFSSELFQLYSGFFSIIISAIAVFISSATLSGLNWLATIALLGGVIASFGGVMKPYALRSIDSTIFFPLFKLLSPLLAVLFGIIYFGENFSGPEWLGIVLGLTVPLLLINKVENLRQSNLKLGITLIILIATCSAIAAAMNKYAIDGELPFITALMYASIGVFVGSVMSVAYKHGVLNVYKHIIEDSSLHLVFSSFARSLLICTSMGIVLFAYNDGTLGIVQTIHSMYILIPIVLSIYVFNEHWNSRKVAAIILSLAALWFFH